MNDEVLEALTVRSGVRFMGAAALLLVAVAMLVAACAGRLVTVHDAKPRPVTLPCVVENVKITFLERAAVDAACRTPGQPLVIDDGRVAPPGSFSRGCFHPVVSADEKGLRISGEIITHFDKDDAWAEVEHLYYNACQTPTKGED